MKYSLLLLTILLLLSVSCEDQQPDADLIIGQSLEAHGADAMQKSTLSFNFRGIDYSVTRDGGNYEYARYIYQKEDTIIDRLTNNDFTRSQGDSIYNLNEADVKRYRSSLNSVVYFSQLPFSLDGDAVHRKYLGSVELDSSLYHKVKVTFDENGGGEDHEDVFIYWINQDTDMVDYLAYSFCEEECGYRFRESYNRRNLNGVTIQDYHNYKTKSLDIDIVDLDEMFEKGELVKVSDIELQNARVID